MQDGPWHPPEGGVWWPGEQTADWNREEPGHGPGVGVSEVSSFQENFLEGQREPKVREVCPNSGAEVVATSTVGDTFIGGCKLPEKPSLKMTQEMCNPLWMLHIAIRHPNEMGTILAE